jgi:hypothetical protein
MNADGTPYRGDSPTDAHDAPLVRNARSIGGANRTDLGAYPVPPSYIAIAFLHLIFMLHVDIL